MGFFVMISMTGVVLLHFYVINQVGNLHVLYLTLHLNFPQQVYKLYPLPERKCYVSTYLPEYQLTVKIPDKWSSSLITKTQSQRLAAIS